MPRTAEPDIEQRIIEASLQVILKVGLGGLRVREVARLSGTTVAMIYRRFVDRDGLLDATVAHFYEIRIRSVVGKTQELAASERPLSLDDVVSVLPLPNYEGSAVVHSVIARVPALAHENSVFRRRIEAFVEEQYPLFERAVIDIVDRLPPAEQFDYRIVTTLVLNQNWTLNDLRGKFRVSNDEYQEFMRRLLLSSLPVAAAEGDQRLTRK